MNEIAKPQTRRQHTRQATIAAILDAARVQMRAEGAAALSLNEVARQVGLRPPSLYEYFPGGKFAIYDALFRLGYEQCILMTEPFARIDDPWELLQAMAEFFFTFATANPDLYQLCFERPVPGFVPSDESLAVSFGVLNQFRAHMERVLAPLPNTTGLTIEQFFTLAIALMPLR